LGAGAAAPGSAKRASLPDRDLPAICQVRQPYHLQFTSHHATVNPWESVPDFVTIALFASKKIFLGYEIVVERDIFTKMQIILQS
jgi:hypothetical protein